jgi:hypothetical protein
LRTEDLIDFYLPRDRKILPLNKIKEEILLCTDKDYQLVKDRFNGIGSCDTIGLINLDFDTLAQYYLISYNPISNKDRG